MFPVIPEPRPEAQPVVFAKTQQHLYHPLPANLRRPYAETKWKLSWRERLSAFFGGHIYLTLKIFDQPLQPIRMSTLRQDKILGGISASAHISKQCG